MRVYVTERITIEHDDRQIDEGDLPGAQGRLTFARLAVEHDRPVTADALGALLWPDALPKAWEKALAAVISKIRAALGKLGIDGRAAISNAFGCYQLTLPAGTWIDLDAVGDGLEAAAAASDDQAKAAAASVAASLARRAFLPGYDDPWIEAVRATRRAQLAQALDLLAEAQVGPQAIAAAEEAVALDAFREPGWVRLMQAMAAAGDRAGALKAYERCRSFLADELGIDPSSATQQVYLDLLREEPDAGEVRLTHAHSIPIARTAFVGRTRELDEISAALEGPGVVTLTGPGGSGKTRLACEAALRVLERFPGGAWFVDLAPIRDDDVIAAEIARALGLALDPGDDPVAAIASRLPGTLVLVDNCEHVLDGARATLAAIGAVAPEARILATSRQAIGLRAERAMPVPPLPLGEATDDLARLHEVPAIRLFCDRAEYARPDFELTVDNAAAVTSICRRLDGLPLALELAAARIRVLSPEQIDARLHDAFTLLTRSLHGAPDRQESLQAAIAWSVNLLTDAQRALLGRMSLFPGGCTLEAVEQALSGDPVERSEIVDLVQELADRNLVTAHDERDAVRYRMLETIRSYAATIAAPSEIERYAGRCVAWLAERAAEAAPHLVGRDQAVWLDRLAREHDNLRDALDRAPPHVRLAMAADLERFWLLRGYWFEGRRRVAEALAGAPDAPGALRSRGHAALAYMAQQQGDAGTARTEAMRAIDLAREAGADAELAKALLQLANAEYLAADLERAERYYAQAIEACRTVGDLRGEGIAVSNLGAVWHDRGDLERAERSYLEGVGIDRELGNLDDVAMGLANLGTLAYDRGDLDASDTYLHEALAIQRALDTPAIIATLHSLARTAVARGELEAAGPLIDECRARSEEVGHAIGVASCIELSGARAFRAGDLVAASSLYREAIEAFDAIGPRPQMAATLIDAAEVERARGRTADAATLLRRSIETAIESGNATDEARAREALSSLG